MHERAFPVTDLLHSFVFAILLLTPSMAAAQTTIRTDVDTTLVTVGDRVRLTVQIEHTEGTSVVWPDSLDLTPFEVLSARIAPSRPGEGGVLSVADFDLTAFELGELELPSFDVTVLAADGATEVLETDRFGIEVVSVGADDTGDIRGIRGPLSIPLGALTIATWLLGLLLVAAAGIWAYRRWTRGAPGVDEVPAGPPPRPPHEEALEALDQLEASDLLIRGEVKTWHIRVSDILRRYVERRFGVAALEMTTWEVLDGLARVGASAHTRDGLRHFLDRCDLVKFAKARPDADASRAVLHLGREVVLQSIEVAEPASERTEPAPESDAGTAEVEV